MHDARLPAPKAKSEGLLTRALKREVTRVSSLAMDFLRLPDEIGKEEDGL